MIGRVKKKMEAGATFFMTQPAFCDEDIERIATIKKETGSLKWTAAAFIIPTVCGAAICFIISSLARLTGIAA